MTSASGLSHFVNSMDYQPIQLSQTQIQQFQDDGFLILENFFASGVCSTPSQPPGAHVPR